MKNVTILGSTGSIGLNTLNVIGQHRDKYRLFALTAHKTVDKLFEQILEFKPRYAVLIDEQAASRLQSQLIQAACDTQLLLGPQALEFVSAHESVDYVMAAIVGAAGLLPTLAAAKAGKRIMLANKESLVMSGDLLINSVKQYGAELLPIDSEHNAIFQSMPGSYSVVADNRQGVEKIILTGSGGPFLKTPLKDLPSRTPAQACKHPNWLMGRKISVDSATMMNKGLEVIEACFLFSTQVDRIEVVVHPQSIIHSMVQYVDGSVIAQLGNPDMRTPIAHALAWPDRIESGVARLDFTALSRLDFAEPDWQRFPCLRLAIQAIKKGGTAPTSLNAANEIAVESFLSGNILFTDISQVIEYVQSRCHWQQADSLDKILQVDADARRIAMDSVNAIKRGSKISL